VTRQSRQSHAVNASRLQERAAAPRTFDRTRGLRRILICSLALGQLLLLGSGADAAQHRHQTRKPGPPHKAAATPQPVDQKVLATQVMLDRAGFSPGEIDGRAGTSTTRALDVFTKSGGNAQALPQDAVTPYTITEQDAAGPFTPLPDDMMELSKLPALGYASLLEALGERFHASPDLLKRLNPHAAFAAGETINVPNVSAAVAPVGPPAGRQNDPSSPAITTVSVHKGSSDLVVTDNTGNVLMYAPVTTGSEHDPLPIGEWKVNGVQHNPKVHYNPALFWDAEPGHAKATIAAGPNNPVGVVWVDISRPHYGLHGTPEPSKIGKTESHGCVRLTNWDALKLASLVKPGTRVIFAE
jgi:lipoprotein-anchoring transpeptidase ErfK/SrfK